MRAVYRPVAWGGCCVLNIMWLWQQLEMISYQPAFTVFLFFFWNPWKPFNIDNRLAFLPQPYFWLLPFSAFLGEPSHKEVITNAYSGSATRAVIIRYGNADLAGYGWYRHVRGVMPASPTSLSPAEKCDQSPIFSTLVTF